MSSTSQAITGRKLPEAQFRLQESFGQLDLTYIATLLSGQLAAYCVRGFLDSQRQRRIVENFWNSTARTPRYGEGEGGIEGYFVGASHIEKTTQEYLNEAQHFEEALAKLYQGTLDPLGLLRDRLRSGLMDVRAASHEGRPAGAAKAVYWNNVGEFLLLPHDDLAQLSDPRQAGFEIQQIERVIAANFYAEMPTSGGELKVWNIEPDIQSRERLGLTHSGFPYPAELLNGYAHMTIDIEAGDLVLLNGNLIHAVLGGAGAVPKRRLLITCFMGRLPTDELVWWT